MLKIKFMENKIIPKSPVICPRLVAIEFKSKNLKDMGSKKNHLIIGINVKRIIMNKGILFFNFTLLLYHKIP